MGYAVGEFWYLEGREIQLCDAIKDFYDRENRAPSDLGELPEPYRQWTATRDGRPYRFSCHDEGGVPSCGISWDGDEPNHSIGRSCGRLDRRELTDWF